MKPEIIEQIKEYVAGLPEHTQEMDDHMDRLREICANPVVESAFNEAIAHVYPVTETGQDNPWMDASIQHFIMYFDAWFTDLPVPTGGLGFILPFSWMYYNNRSAYFFLNELKTCSHDEEEEVEEVEEKDDRGIIARLFGGRRGHRLRVGNRAREEDDHWGDEFTKEIFDWTKEFIMIRGRFMDSEASAPKELMDAWLKDPNTHIEDFIVPTGGFKSFNEFFTRDLNPKMNPRPISDPSDNSIVVASADTIINFILSNLLLTSNINVKGRQISMEKLLDGSDLAKYFVGGTAVSCVLMPNVYHHYHSPVAGTLVESKDIPGIYNGIIDGEHWFNDMSNPGQGDTDFSIFEDFHRAYYIFKTEEYGYVAQVPVGLNTISRICPTLVGNSKYFVKPGGATVDVAKGTKLGNFAYGGSLNILMFEKGVFGCVSLLQGDRLGQMSPKTET